MIRDPHDLPPRPLTAAEIQQLHDWMIGSEPNWTPALCLLCLLLFVGLLAIFFRVSIRFEKSTNKNAQGDNRV